MAKETTVVETTTPEILPAPAGPEVSTTTTVSPAPAVAPAKD